MWFFTPMYTNLIVLFLNLTILQQWPFQLKIILITFYNIKVKKVYFKTPNEL